MRYREMVQNFLEQIGRAWIENRTRPDLPQAQNAKSIGDIFTDNCARHEHETYLRRAGVSRVRDDWLR
jgi:hypothetical protein